MRNPRELARDLAIVTLVGDIVKEQREVLRQQLTEALDTIGADATSAELDGDKIAKVSKVAPKPRPTITNETAFVAWVQANHETEVTLTVRDAFRKYLLEQLEPLEDGTAVNKNTGEIVEGITFGQAAAYVTTRFEKQGRERLAQALAAGALFYDITAHQTKELTTGETE